MPITNAPFYPLAGFWLDKTRVEAVYDVDGQTYHLRQLGRNVFYHREGADAIEQTCFVCCDDALGLPDWPSKIKEESISRSDLPFFEDAKVAGADLQSQSAKPKAQVNSGSSLTRNRVYPASVFAAQLRGGQSGRYALHTSKRYRDCAVIMFLRQDGTGICLHDEQGFFQDRPEAQNRLAFHWDSRTLGLRRPADILNADWHIIASLCEDVLTKEVVPRMTEPFVSYAEKPDEPFEYVCGSAQELEHLTRCILHVHPKLFDINYKRGKIYLDRSREGGLTTRYQATITQEPGGPIVPPKDERQRLLELAFEYNVFRGGEWRPVYQRDEQISRRYIMRPYNQQFYTPPPSAHEQAESLLFLHDWLDGKVSDKERRRLLRLTSVRK